jgi:hypothetical protein
MHGMVPFTPCKAEIDMREVGAEQAALTAPQP